MKASRQAGPARAGRPRWWRSIACAGLVLACGVEALASQDAVARVRQLRQAGRPDEALAVLDDIVARDPGNADLLGLQGLLLLDAGRPEQAGRLAQQLRDYDGPSFRAHAFLGRQRLAAGDAEASIEASRRALDLNPQAVEAAVCLVQGLIAAGRARPAVRAAESLEEVAPEWGRLLGAQALLLQAQKMRAVGEEALPRAVPVLHLALEKDPGNGQILEILIETLIDTIRIDEARRLVDEHFAGEAHAALRHYLLGRSLDVMTDIEAAAREYRAALAADPACTKALLELARIAIEGEDWEQAAAWLDRADPDGGTGSRLLLLRGLTEDGLGRPERARKAYEEALALSPENAKARYLLGRLLVRGGEVDAGLELLAAHASEEDP